MAVPNWIGDLPVALPVWWEEELACAAEAPAASGMAVSSADPLAAVAAAPLELASGAVALLPLEDAAASLAACSTKLPHQLQVSKRCPKMHQHHFGLHGMTNSYLGFK